MRVHSRILMLTLLGSASACSHQDVHLQDHSKFTKAIRDHSSSPYFVKIQILDSISNHRFTTCVTANLFQGALHMEKGLPYTDEGRSAVEKLAIANQEHVFYFKSPSALRNMPWHPSAAELSEAQTLASTISGQNLADSLRSGALRDYYADHPRHRERMAAMACALIDRDLTPRLADIPGSLYVEQ